MVNGSSTRPLAVVTGASNGNGYELVITATGPSINEAVQAFETLGAHVGTVQADLATYDGVETLYMKTQIQGNVSRVLPDTVNAEQHRKLTEPGSANQ